MPENHETVVDSYTSVFPFGVTKLVFCQIGIQVPNTTNTKTVIEQIERIFLSNKVQPTHKDIALNKEDDSTKNIIFLCYFLHDNNYSCWRESSPIVSLLNGEHNFGDKSGIWFESFHIDINEFESSHSNKSKKDGVSHFTDLEVSKKHEYWGAMRDRLRASEWNSFPFSNERIGMTKAGEKTIVHLPSNSCFIRSVQDLSNTTTHEKKLYREMMRPVLNRGIHYLDNNVSSGCIGIKEVNEMNMCAENKDIQSTLAYFRSLKHLEKWSKSHKTHLSIYNEFFNLLSRQDNETFISLWHEVSILDDERTEIFYIRCKETTGLLPYAIADQPV